MKTFIKYIIQIITISLLMNCTTTKNACTSNTCTSNTCTSNACTSNACTSNACTSNEKNIKSIDSIIYQNERMLILDYNEETNF
jgi:hypothetical protein